MQILTLNIGSSSIKYKVFDENLVCVSSDSISGIGTNLCSWPDVKNQTEAMQKLASELIGLGYAPDLICHRVVHGGNYFQAPVIIDQEVMNKIAELGDLAPLHNPIQHDAIKNAIAFFPAAKQIAFFDTAFHSSMPESQTLIPINYGSEIKRYGFHGLNYAYISEQLTYEFHKPVNAIICHLGNGASVCAIKNGKSYATSMGMTPNDGLIMGTRSGAIDSGVIAYLARTRNMSISEIDQVLNNKSGLFAIAGSSDMRECEELAIKGDFNAKKAIAAFTERVRFYIGGYSALVGDIDCLVFTGGIGENSSYIRNKILDNLSGYYLDNKKNMANHKGIISAENSNRVMIINANEEKYMATLALKFLH